MPKKKLSRRQIKQAKQDAERAANAAKRSLRQQYGSDTIPAYKKDVKPIDSALQETLQDLENGRKRNAKSVFRRLGF